ncbi:transcriptional regulator GutM [Zooshikella sp. RANM57]|uniref:transcriptional regulator GutM n=1 Tax=Zooshikella sp. RANM57 TaxID=3425863 RepID=UPI003D6DCA5D
MDPTYILIVLALSAWLMQIFLGFFQVRAFNRLVQSMNEKGNLKIGRTASRWRPRTIILLVQNEHDVIIDAAIMKGFTVFARPRPFHYLINCCLPLRDQDLALLATDEKEAVKCALAIP